LLLVVAAELDQVKAAAVVVLEAIVLVVVYW
jgi:hypothetical protein